MKSNKTTEILTTLHDDEQRGKRVLTLTSIIDNRFGIGKIASRIKTLKPRSAYPIGERTNITELVKKVMPEKILIDEAHFLYKSNVLELEQIFLTYKIPIYAYGLISDSNNNIFDGAAQLLVSATKVIEKERECWYCTKKATKNLRIVDGKPIYNGKAIMIGDTEYYPVCTEHYFNAPLQEE